MCKAHLYIKMFENTSNTKSGLMAHSFVIPALKKPRQGKLFKEFKASLAYIQCQTLSPKNKLGVREMAQWLITTEAYNCL